jgi:hypothetical protein
VKKLSIFASLIFIMANLVYGIGPPAVNLGTAGNYVVLASTGVSTTGTTSIIGNVGVSPVASTYITGFDLILDSSGTYSTSSLVTGRLYAADYTEPTPSNLTTAIGSMGTAYTDAAGRVNPGYTELYAGDLTGQTLVPGLYKWSSVVLISAGGMTISGGQNDTWIFQIAQDFTVADGAIITLSGGAQPQNIFWQVAGQASIGTTAQFKGIILCQTMISMNTGASMSGRLFAQTAVTLDANSIVQPGGSTGAIDDGIPQVISQSSLSSNYPNPFSPNTTIKFNIVKGEQGTLTIYNTKGQAVLRKGFVSGEHNYEWVHAGLSSGVYIYRLQTNTQDISRKMSLIR